MDTMATDINSIVVKQEPIDDPASPNAEENNNGDNRSVRNNDHSTKATPGGSASKDSKNSGDVDPLTSPSHNGPLRYISRRGRPPGGGYSMKSAHSHYVSFGQSSVGMGSHDFLRRSSLGASATSPQDLLKNGLDSSLDSLDARRFGLHCFESDKHSFRCDGCDVVFASRDTYAMHMLLRAKNESCVALPTSAISANPENPTPREKFERELREKAMITAIRSQAALMSKAAVAAAVIPPSSSVVESAIQSLSARSPPSSSKDDLSSFGSSDLTAGLNSLFAFDSYGLYMDQRQYRRLLSEYSFKAASSSPSVITAMMEQLSCSVCGEVFTNKDALAMHMMFHTRDEEGDTKPVVPSWKFDTSPSSIGKMMPLSVNTDTSSVTHRRKHDSSKDDGDRQLTVERIEELKRMAIESSLKSSLKKYPKNTERNPRPKSVSEDTVVTSSAQTRPLSADDAFKMSHSADKGLYKPHKMIFKSSHQKDTQNYGDDDYLSRDRSHYASETSKIPFRKRTLSISDDYLSNLSPFYKRQKHFYSDNDVRSIAFRYDNLKSSISGGLDASFSKVCDNHVSSASGPQDSDETSNGSSSTALESTRVEFEKVSRDAESSSSLENIMSGDSILVPVENPEDLQVNDGDDGEFSNDRHGAAIDFSLGKTGTSDTEENIRDKSDTTTNTTTTTTSASQIQSTSSRMFGHRKHQHPNRHNLSMPENGVGGESPGKEDLLQEEQRQHHVELVSDGDETQTGDIKDSSGRRSYDVTSESSRGGEARYCPHCEILFLDVTLFHLHMGLHNVNNPWQCNICGLACGGRLEFNTHVLHY